MILRGRRRRRGSGGRRGDSTSPAKTAYTKVLDHGISISRKRAAEVHDVSEAKVSFASQVCSQERKLTVKLKLKARETTSEEIE